jgi:ribosomal protein S18 acetylase RimI-like enzyme
MSTPLEVSAATVLDVLPMVALQRQVIAEGPWFVTEPDELVDPESEARAVVQDAARGEGLALVARRRPGGPLLGWAWVSHAGRRRSRHVGLLEMMVHPRARRAGVGRALLEAVCTRAPAAGFERLTLNVFAHNAAARALYAVSGFVEEGLRVGAYRFPDGTLRDEVLMSRSLAREGFPRVHAPRDGSG